MQRILKSRMVLALTALVLAACCWWPAQQLQLDESIESFFARHDPLLKAYQRSRATFGGDEFVMVAYQVDDPFSRQERRRLQEFASQLSQIPGVRATSTQELASTLENPNATGLVAIAQRLPATETALTELSRRVLIGDDSRTLAIVLRLLPSANGPVSRTQTFSEIRQLASQFPEPTFVAGEPLQVHDMFRYIEHDGRVLGIACTLVLLLVIFVMFRSPRWMLLPIIIVQVTLLWTRALLYISDIHLSMVSSMLNSLVTIISIATVMHLTVVYREERRTQDRTAAFSSAFQQLWRPVLGTCLTTVIGFAALLTSQVTPIQSFGLMMSVGTIFVPIACLCLLPAGVLIGGDAMDPGRVPAEGIMVSMLRRLARWADRSTQKILAGMIFLSMIAGVGLLFLKVETDFSRNFRSGSTIVRSLQFFEQNLGGVGSWEVGFTAPAELDEGYLDQVRQLTHELRTLQISGTGLTKVVSLTDGLDLIPRLPAPGGKRPGLLGLIPKFIEPSLEQRLELIHELQPEMTPSLYNPKQNRMRIVLRSLEQQPAQVKLKLISEVERIGQRHFPDAQAAGLYVLLANLISSILGDQVVTFAISAIGIVLAMSWGFRSYQIGLISLIPNALPILLLTGTMGWLGIPVNIGTAMIASVSMGLTVDSTIHYLVQYQRARRAGSSHLEAVRESHAGVGRALVLANIALVAGFAVLALSHFVPLIYFGILVSLAMVGGLLGNLLVLPVLLRLIASDPPGTASTLESTMQQQPMAGLTG